MNDENSQVHLKAGNCAVTHLRHLAKSKAMLLDRNAEVKFACRLRSEQGFHRVQLKCVVAVKKVNAQFSFLHLNMFGIFWFKLVWQLHRCKRIQAAAHLSVSNEAARK